MILRRSARPGLTLVLVIAYASVALRSTRSAAQVDACNLVQNNQPVQEADGGTPRCIPGATGCYECVDTSLAQGYRLCAYSNYWGGPYFCEDQNTVPSWFGISRDPGIDPEDSWPVPPEDPNNQETSPPSDTSPP